MHAIMVIFWFLFFQCGYTFCFDCKESWHIGMTCEEYKEVISDSASGVRWAIEIKNSDIFLLICTLHKFANLCFVLLGTFCNMFWILQLGVTMSRKSDNLCYATAFSVTLAACWAEYWILSVAFNIQGNARFGSSILKWSPRALLSIA